METYYCERCGALLESSDCVKERRFSLHVSNLRCPRCGGRVMVSGPAFIVLGSILALFSGVCCFDIGVAAGGGLAALGILRAVKWRLAVRRWRRAHAGGDDGAGPEGGTPT